MWQRHTQSCAFSGTSERIAAGWGSWTMITSQPPSSSRAFISLYAVADLPLLLGEVVGVALERVVEAASWR